MTVRLDFSAKCLRLAMLVTAMLALTACVTDSIFVDLGYPPEEEQEYAELDTAGHSSVGLRSRSLTLVVVDEREEKGRIGIVNTGLLGESYSYAHTDDNISLWVYDSVTHELALYDYHVVDAQTASGDEAIDQLEISVTAVNSKCFYGCEASVSFSTSLKDSRGEVTSAEFAGVESKAGMPGFWVSMLEEALRRALQESIRSMLIDLAFVTDSSLRDAKISGLPN